MVLLGLPAEKARRGARDRLRHIGILELRSDLRDALGQADDIRLLETRFPDQRRELFEVFL